MATEKGADRLRDFGDLAFPDLKHRSSYSAWQDQARCLEGDRRIRRYMPYPDMGVEATGDRERRVQDGFGIFGPTQRNEDRS